MEDSQILSLIASSHNTEVGFKHLVQKYQRKVYWHIRKMVQNHDDADDLTQDTFVKVFQNLKNFREEAQLYTWIYRIATNECLNFLAKKNKYSMVEIDEAQNSIVETDSKPLMDGQAIQQKLEQALNTLPTKQKLVFNMKYYDDLKYEEIAEITGTSVGALKTSYHLAVKKIEEILNND
jgi:RNA polymerase sigma factor (sigma-70 family)